MFLASCAYMLEPIIAVRRKWGIPFHNPYRRSNGFWNPLRLGCKEASANRILSLLAVHPDCGDESRTWTYREVSCWAGWLRSRGILKPNAMAQIEQSIGSLSVTAETLCGLFETGSLESLLAAFDGDNRQLLDWWRLRLATHFLPRVRFPRQVALRNGPGALKEPPKVIVGTIHSVKGGEADVVFLFPDLSNAGGAAYQRHGPQRDAVLRLFYVGVTRARETLYVCQNETSTTAKI